MIDSVRARNAASALSLRLMKMKPTADGRAIESRRKTTMSDYCITDPFEQCFHDCPNCPQCGYYSGVYLDENDRIYDDDDERDDLYYGD